MHKNVDGVVGFREVSGLWNSQKVEESLSHEDEALMQWAADAKPFGVAAGVKEYADWLVNEASAVDRHVAITSWNWDSGEEPLIWAIRRKDCELATALEVFWLANPGDYYVAYDGDRNKAEDWSLKYFDLIAEIRQRVLDGFYTHSTIAFDGEEKFRENFGDEESPELDRLIPAPFRQVISGIDSAAATEDQVYHNGFPAKFGAMRGGR